MNPALLEYLLVRLFPLLAMGVLIGLAETHTAVHGGSGIKGFFAWLSKGGPFAAVLNKAAQAARWVLSKFGGANLLAIAHWLTAVKVLQRAQAKTQADFSVASAAAITHVDNEVSLANKRIARTNTLIARFKAQTLQREKALHHATTVTLPREIGQLRHIEKRLTHAIDVTLPRDIAGVRRREEALSRDQAKLRGRTTALEDGAIDTWRWIRTHPLSATTGVFAGAVAIALTRMGFGFLRCRNWQNLGKRLTCGMGKWLLDALEAVAAFALAYLAILKPEVLAEETVAAVDGIESLLTQILDN